jgi:hypothetical protein
VVKPINSHNRTKNVAFRNNINVYLFLLVELMKNQSQENVYIMENMEALGAVHS